MKAGEALVFLTLAAGLHLAVFWNVADGTGAPPPSEGAGAATLGSADATLAALVESWSRPPEAAPTPQLDPQTPPRAGPTPTALPAPDAPARPAQEPPTLPSLAPDATVPPPCPSRRPSLHPRWPLRPRRCPHLPPCQRPRFLISPPPRLRSGPRSPTPHWKWRPPGPPLRSKTAPRLLCAPRRAPKPGPRAPQPPPRNPRAHPPLRPLLLSPAAPPERQPRRPRSRPRRVPPVRPRCAPAGAPRSPRGSSAASAGSAGGNPVPRSCGCGWHPRANSWGFRLSAARAMRPSTRRPWPPFGAQAACPVRPAGSPRPAMPSICRSAFDPRAQARSEYSIVSVFTTMSSS